MFKRSKMNLNRGLHESTYIIKKYKTEEKMRKLSKEQLEKVMSTLHNELQFQNSKLSSFLAWLGLYLAVFVFIIPIVSNAKVSGEFRKFDGKMYQLESVELKMVGEENDVVNGTFSRYDYEGIQNSLLALNIGGGFLVLICIYYLRALRITSKIHKLYNLARYLHSRK